MSTSLTFILLALFGMIVLVSLQQSSVIDIMGQVSPLSYHNKKKRKKKKSPRSVFQKTNTIVIPMFIFLTFIIQTLSCHSYFILRKSTGKTQSPWLTDKSCSSAPLPPSQCDSVNHSINLSCTVSVDKSPAINWRHCCVAAVTKPGELRRQTPEHRSEAMKV